MADDLDPKVLKRLRDAMKYSRTQLQPFRDVREHLLKQYVGKHYGDNGAADKVPLNLLELATNIYRRQLVAASPRVLVTTRRRQFKTYAQDLEVAVNTRIRSMRLGNTIDNAVFDAMFGIGVIKTCLHPVGDYEEGDTRYTVGEPFADCISLDDWVCDMNGRRYDQAQFAGHGYRIRLDEAKENPAYSKTAREKLSSAESRAFDDLGQARDQALSNSGANDVEELYETTRVWDLWLPQDQLIVTIAEDGCGPEEPLCVKEWTGPETGPYHLLTFTDVPGNIMPLAPASMWLDIHELVNKLALKLGRQAERQKTIGVFQGSAEEDAKRITNAADGEMIRADNPQQTREARFGGVEPTTLAYMLQMRDVFSWMAGNLDALGGLSPQSGTLGQDELLAKSASQRVVSMQDRTTEFVRGVVRDIAWYDWYDPLYEQEVEHTVAGTDIRYATTMTAEDRKGEWFDYTYDIDPYSMQHTSPSMRLGTLLQTFTQIVAPSMPLLAQQGIRVDYQELMRLISKYGNMPELEDVLVMTSAYPEPGNTSGERIGMPDNTTRTYERVNRPGATRQQKDQMMSHMMMGGGAQPAETATMNRMPG